MSFLILRFTHVCIHTMIHVMMCKICATATKDHASWIRRQQCWWSGQSAWRRAVAAHHATGEVLLQRGHGPCARGGHRHGREWGWERYFSGFFFFFFFFKCNRSQKVLQCSTKMFYKMFLKYNRIVQQKCFTKCF